MQSTSYTCWLLLEILSHYCPASLVYELTLASGQFPSLSQKLLDNEMMPRQWTVRTKSLREPCRQAWDALALLVCPSWGPGPSVLVPFSFVYGL